jgi:hypothetical protein
MNLLEIKTLSSSVIDFIFTKRVGNYTFMRNQNYSVQEVIHLCEFSWNVKFNLIVDSPEKNWDKEVVSIWANKNNENVVLESPDIRLELSRLWKNFQEKVS